MQSEKINVIGGIDGVRDAVDFVGDGNAPPQDGVVFDVVDHEGGIVEHLHHLADSVELFVGDPQPCVEGLSEDQTFSYPQNDPNSNVM